LARYQLSADDIRYVHEFLREPFGYKSPGLQRVLNLMRGSGPKGKYVIICKNSPARWQLGLLPGRRGEAIVDVPGVEYADLASAERDVFLRRWRDLGGPHPYTPQRMLA
jgi:hypothetical protein